MPLEVVIMVGLQASGKTTYFRDRYAQTHDHISKDNFRSNPDRPARQMQLIGEALAANRSIVVDNTNVTRADRATIAAQARQFGADVIVYSFEVDVEGSKLRNAERTGWRKVPDVGLFGTLKRYERPTMDEDIDRLWEIRTLPDFKFAVIGLHQRTEWLREK